MVKTIYIKTTGTCNLNCEHCFTNGRDGIKDEFDPILTAKWVKEYMSKYPENQKYHFEFHGGEPFLVPIEKLIIFADSFYNNTNITMCANSNLTFKLTKNIINFIYYYFSGHIGTSWDKWIRWDNDKQYDLWKRNVTELKENGFYIHLKVSISKQLIEKTPLWFLYELSHLDIDEVSLERLTYDGNATLSNDIFPDNEEQDNWYLALYKEYKKLRLSFKIKTLDILEEKIKNNIVKVDTNCRNCEQHLVTINSDGTLGGCPNTASNKKHSTILQPVQFFLKSPSRINEIAKELSFNENCIQCNVFHICGGDCHQLPWQNNRCGGLKNTLRYLVNTIG